MDWRRYVQRSLLHYWPSHLAVLLGVLVGSAAISGALIVGDSVRWSLRQMTLKRLGHVDCALHGQRFFTEQLAGRLARLESVEPLCGSVAPALVLTGTLDRRSDQTAGGKETFSRAGGVHVFGVDERLWNLLDRRDVPAPTGDEVLVSQRLANELGAAPGDRLTLWVELPPSLPRDTLLGGGDKPVSVELSVTLREVLPPDLGVGRFDLKPGQQVPKVAFVSLRTLQSALELSAVRPSRRHPHGRPARVNALLVQGGSEVTTTDSAARDVARQLTSVLPEALEPDDLQLRFRVNSKLGYVSVESERLYLEPPLVEAVGLAAESLGARLSPVLVYLANELSNAAQPDHYSAYSVVAGVSFETEPPFGPFRFVAGRPPRSDDEIVLNQWLAEDLAVQVGQTVRLTYYVVGSHRELSEREQRFQVCGVVALDGTVAEDPVLTPEVRGITDADDVAHWQQPFPMKLDRITDRDEQYWDRYRATPKAFVRLQTAQRLWGNRYGQVTSVRVAPAAGQKLEQFQRELRQKVARAVQPERLGLVFRAVKYEGLEAASGTTDFAGLFFGFSFFVILAALILIGLLFRLTVERRTAQVGLLLAVGLTARRVRRLFLLEGSAVVVLGALLGQLAAAGYAAVLIHGLKTWWFGAIRTRFLLLHVEPTSVLTGFAVSVVSALAAVWWSFRGLRRLSVRELLAGVSDVALTAAAQQRRARRAGQVATAAVAVSVVLVAASLLGLVPATEAFGGLSWRVVAFFVVGLCLLTACLAGLSAWLDSDRVFAVRGRGLAGLARLALRNAGRNRRRSVLSTGLVATATFVIVAVAAGRRNPAVEQPELHSGNGGFLFVAESAVPVLHNLNTPEGREKLDLAFPAGSPEERLLEKMLAVSFRVKPGEDASCLNLFRPRRPTILGVPRELVERDGFAFADTRAENPWKLLEQPQDDGTIPALGDMNTLLYSLHKSIGDTLLLEDDRGRPVKLKIVGQLNGSVFQGVLLISEQDFLKLFPDVAGYRYFLIGDRRFQSSGSADTAVALSDEEADRLQDLLETRLAPYGFDVERVADRLAEFLSVQNTYLSTFLVLGGLGLLLGTFGLSAVLLRNVLERRAELALLRAVGFRRGQLAWLVLWENTALLAWGLLGGTVSALAAMTPHLTSIGADVDWKTLFATLLAVLLVGLLSALLAVREATAANLLASLRRE